MNIQESHKISINQTSIIPKEQVSNYYKFNFQKLYKTSLTTKKTPNWRHISILFSQPCLDDSNRDACQIGYLQGYFDNNEESYKLMLSEMS